MLIYAVAAESLLSSFWHEVPITIKVRHRISREYLFSVFTPESYTNYESGHTAGKQGFGYN